MSEATEFASLTALHLTGSFDPCNFGLANLSDSWAFRVTTKCFRKSLYTTLEIKREKRVSPVDLAMKSSVICRFPDKVLGYTSVSGSIKYLVIR